MQDDIPLAEAQVIWDYHGNKPDVPPVRVMTISEKDDPDYFASWGACNMDFNEADDAGRLLMLFKQFHYMVLFDGLDPRDVHAAFLCIPEYRVTIPEGAAPRRAPVSDNPRERALQAAIQDARAAERSGRPLTVDQLGERINAHLQEQGRE